LGFSLDGLRPKVYCEQCRLLRVVIERPQTIHLWAEVVERSWRSTVDRALFECAVRVDLAGGMTQRASKDGVDATVVERDFVLAHVEARLHRAVLPDSGQLVISSENTFCDTADPARTPTTVISTNWI
jgi:hypothetical protein